MLRRLPPGLAPMLGGYLLLGCMPLLVKQLRAYGFLSAQVVSVRFLLGAVLAVVVARLLGAPLSTKQPGLLLVRGVLGGVAVLLYFASIQLAGASVGTLLNYTYPVWANVLGVFFGHRPERRVWWLLVLALSGTFLVVDPVLGTLSLGEGYGLLSAVVAGGAVVTIKKLRETDGELTIILSFSVLGALLALPWAAAEFTSQPAALELNWTSAALLLGVGVVSFCGHVLFTRAYKHTSIQVGSMLSFLVPVVATVLGAVLLDEPVGPGLLVGGGLILLACGLVGRPPSPVSDSPSEAQREHPGSARRTRG